jgi:hypothetical protein
MIGRYRKVGIEFAAKTHLLESDVLGLLSECLTRHVQAVLADETRLLAVTGDTAVVKGIIVSMMSLLT